MASTAETLAKVAQALHKKLEASEDTATVRQRLDIQHRRNFAGNLGNVVGKGEGVTNFATGIAGQQSSFGAAGQAMGGLGDKLMGTGNPYAVAAGAALKLAGALTESIDTLRGWGRSLEQTNLDFARFSGSMAIVQSQFQQREFFIKMGQGEARADSAERLATAIADLDQTLAPMEDLWANFKNDFAAQCLGLLKNIYDAIPDKLKPAEPNSDVLNKAAAAWNKQMHEQVDTYWKRRPARFPGGGGQ